MASAQPTMPTDGDQKESLYVGREQSLVKHVVLHRYLERFAFIIGSHWDSITYVDCFSGPWRSRSQELADTSFSVAIRELRKARDGLEQRGRKIDLRCFFLERSRKPFEQLDHYASQIRDVEVETRNGALEHSVDEIVNFVGQRESFPFVFIDPTGWTGLAIDVIQPLLSLQPGEVLINFMTEYVRRFIEWPDQENQKSFARFFGEEGFLQTLHGLSDRDRDDALVFRYVDRVKKAGGFSFASVAVVLHPENARSYFHLVYLTRNPKGIEVFKDSERRAMEVMETARAEAQQRKRQRKGGGQRELFGAIETHDTSCFNELRQHYCEVARSRVIDVLQAKRRVLYDDLWATAMRFPLVWESDIKEWIKRWQTDGRLAAIEGMEPKQRVPRRKQRNILVWKE